MKNSKLIRCFFSELIQRSKVWFYLLVFFGVVNSLLQGVSIVLIIPLLETFEGKNTESFFIRILNKLGWNGSLEYLLGFYFLILISYAIFRASYNFFAAKMVSSFSKSYAFFTFSKISGTNWNFHLKIEPSRLTNLFSTEYQSIRMLTQYAFRIIQSLLLVVIQLIMSFWLSWQITLITILALCVIYIIQKRLIHLNYQFGGNRLSISQSLQKFLSETFSAIKLLKVHKLESNRCITYSEIQDDLYENEVKTARLEGIIDFIFITSSAIVVVAIIYVNFHFNFLKVSGLLILIVLLSKAITQAQSLVKFISVFMNNLPSFSHFQDVLNQAEIHTNQTAAIALPKRHIDIITFMNISFSYGEKKILNNRNFQFQRGKLYLLFGPSGRGKTTTLDLIAGLIQPTSGEVHLNNQLINSTVGLVDNVSYVLQETLLFEGTITDNITIGGQFSLAEVNSVVDLVGLNALIKDLPNGLDTIINEGATMLSGGEKQRIAIARALIRNSDLILLDEITSSLDVHNETTIMNVISAIKTDKIIIMVGHRERLKDYADEVIYY